MIPTPPPPRSPHPQETLVDSIVMNANILYDMTEMLPRLEFMYCTVNQCGNQQTAVLSECLNGQMFRSLARREQSNHFN